MTPSYSPDLLTRILALSAEAEADGNYETAYHLLMGALHDAEHRSDMAAVGQVTEAADDQEGRLEAIDPPHRLSSAAAELRGGTALYRTLQTHADAVRARLKSASIREQR